MTNATPWLVVSGGKGGVGKTLLATNLAILAAKTGRRVMLVDFDPGLGNVAVHMRLGATHTIEDVVSGECSVEDALLDAPGGISLLGGASGVSVLASDADAVNAAIEAVDRAAVEFDLVVCDTGAGVGPAVLAPLRRATSALALTTSDPAAVTDCYALMKVLHLEGVALPGLVVNRANSAEAAMRTATRLSAVTKKFLGVAPATSGWLHDHRDVERSVREQRPLALEGGSPVIEDLRAILAAALVGLPKARRAALPPRR